MEGATDPSAPASLRHWIRPSVESFFLTCNIFLLKDQLFGLKLILKLNVLAGLLQLSGWLLFDDGLVHYDVLLPAHGHAKNTRH